MTHTPHAARPCSPLKNGNRQGDWHNAPRCGAKTRKGTPCRSAGMPNGRCRMHGGTNSGASKGNRNVWKHRGRSAEVIEAASYLREIKRLLRDEARGLAPMQDKRSSDIQT